MGGSIIGIALFFIVILHMIYKKIKNKKFDLLLLVILLLTIIMSYPVLCFLELGQIAYPVDIENTRPIAKISLPINKPTVVGWGGNSIETNYPHAVVPMERWAYDLLISPYSINDKNLQSYGIYGEEIICPANGYIVGTYDEEDDNVLGTENNRSMVGNYIYLKLEDTGTYLIFAHLKKGSILVKEGEYIKEGEPMAKVGNSGLSSEPHLHIHHQRQNPKTTSIFLTEGLPLYFRNINGPAMPKGGVKGEIISPLNNKY
ncbi:MAG: M23 family metallopeptidase [Firmicutes bacterium]|nr:M23 family metallopeptidase [Bacillota bacterium]